jgi:hypothetical protein
MGSVLPDLVCNVIVRPPAPEPGTHPLVSVATGDGGQFGWPSHGGLPMRLVSALAPLIVNGPVEISADITGYSATARAVTEPAKTNLAIADLAAATWVGISQANAGIDRAAPVIWLPAPEPLTLRVIADGT